MAQGMGQAQSKSCPNCGSLMPMATKFCPNCGAEQQMPQAPGPSAPAGAQKFCPNCGSQVSAGTKFCANCGKPL